MLESDIHANINFKMPKTKWGGVAELTAFSNFYKIDKRILNMLLKVQIDLIRPQYEIILINEVDKILLDDKCTRGLVHVIQQRHMPSAWGKSLERGRSIPDCHKRIYRSYTLLTFLVSII